MFFWLKPLYGIISFIGYAVAFAMTLSELRLVSMDNGNKLPGILKSSIILSICICCMSEFGLFQYQSYDYIAHNFKFHILATQPLPVYEPGKNIYMCYYLGFYLIPALLGKYTFLAWTKYYFFMWSVLGVSLTFAWIQIRFIELQRWKRIIVCLSLLIGSYVSVLYPFFRFVFPQMDFIRDNAVHVAGNFVLNQVPIFTRSLSESPQHTIPCILGMAFLLAVWKSKPHLFSILFFLPATLFLTPFATIGMLPFVLVPAFSYFKELTATSFLKGFWFVLVMTLAYVPILLFLTGSEATDMGSNRAIWNSDPQKWLLYYIFYLFCSYGIWFLLFGRELFTFDRKMVAIAAGFPIVLSLFQIGYYNDLNIRSMLCVQMVLSLSIANVLVRRFNGQTKMNRLLLFGFIFWMTNSISMLKFYYDRIFVFKGQQNSIENPKIPGYGNDYYDLIQKAYEANGSEVVKQYSLRKGSVFEEYMLKKHDH